MDDATRRRPLLVTVVSALVLIAGVVVLLSGAALVAQRDNAIVQIPLLLARVDESLPFDNGQDLGVYVAVIGALVGISGVVLGALGLGVARGRAAAYVVVVVMVAALMIGALVVRGRVADDLAQLFVTALGAALGVLLALVLVLLVGRRSRAWVLGRETTT
jgi:hypothetical protein